MVRRADYLDGKCLVTDSYIWLWTIVYLTVTYLKLLMTVLHLSLPENNGVQIPESPLKCGVETTDPVSM